MGRFLNPGNEAFSEVIHSEIYVDKTPLLEYTNKVISTTSKFICSSRPRRFGKSITAEMLSAYYSKGCDSRALFADYAICKASSFEKHLNQYDVIHFDVQWCMMDAGNADQVVEYINNGILQELKEKYGELIPDTVKTAYGAMSYIKAAIGNKFVVIIDEWDVLIRDEAQNHKVQEEYIDFLRGMFKGSEPSKYIALAYLTGILPIKKLKTQSALNNFEEFTMLDAGRMAPYVGFTEEEVQDLCDRYGQNYEQVKEMMDVENYLQYFCANLYLANAFYGEDTVMTWRTISENGTGFGDGRWRFLMCRLDNSMGNNATGGKTTATIDSYLMESVSQDIFFRALLHNEEFRNSLSSVMQEMAEHTFAEEEVETVLGQLAAEKKKVVLSNYKRFRGNIEDTVYHQEVGKIQEFFRERATYILRYTQEVAEGTVNWDAEIPPEQTAAEEGTENLNE